MSSGPLPRVGMGKSTIVLLPEGRTPILFAPSSVNQTLSSSSRARPVGRQADVGMGTSPPPPVAGSSIASAFPLCSSTQIRPDLSDPMFVGLTLGRGRSNSVIVPAEYRPIRLSSSSTNQTPPDG